MSFRPTEPLLYCAYCDSTVHRRWRHATNNRCNWCQRVMVELSAIRVEATVNPLAATTAAQLSPDEPLILGRKVLIEKRTY